MTLVLASCIQSPCPSDTTTLPPPYASARFPRPKDPPPYTEKSSPIKTKSKHLHKSRSSPDSSNLCKCCPICCLQYLRGKLRACVEQQRKPYSAVTVQIDRLTSEQYEENDLGGIVDLIEVIRIQESGPTEAARAIRKKLYVCHCRFLASYATNRRLANMEVCTANSVPLQF